MDNFGWSLAISDDTAIVGMANHTDSSTITTSAAYILERNQGGEVRTVTLEPDELFHPKIEARNITIARQT